MSGLVTHGLVIRRADYSDYDRMVTIFSPEMGEFGAMLGGSELYFGPDLIRCKGSVFIVSDKAFSGFGRYDFFQHNNSS